MKISTYCEMFGSLPQWVSPVYSAPRISGMSITVIDTMANSTDSHLRDREADAHRGLDEVAVDAEQDDERRDGGEDQELDEVAELGPRHRRPLAGAAVEEKAHVGGEDQHVDRGVLRRHHAEEAEDRMQRAAHGRISLTEARIERGVAHTAKQMAIVASRYFTYFW